MLETLPASWSSALAAEGVAFETFVLAWLRVLPTVLLVPAFGLRGTPVPLRLAMGMILVLGLAPAAIDTQPMEVTWPAAGAELLRGLPVAVGAAAVLWSAGMVGAVFDEVIAISRRSLADQLAGARGGMEVLTGLFAVLVFLKAGGPARVISALFISSGIREESLLERASVEVLASVNVAVAIGAPILLASVLLEVILAIAQRMSETGPLGAVFPALRTAMLLLVAIFLYAQVSQALAWIVLREG